MHRITPLLVLVLVALVPGPAWSQPSPSDPASAVAEADRLYFEGHPQEAYATLLEHLDREPDDYEALWRAVRAAVVVGSGIEGHIEQNYWFDPAIELGDRAVAH